MNSKDSSSLNILITFILLVVVIMAYIFLNKYVIQKPADTEKEVTKKESEQLTDNEVLKLAYDKYYAGISMLTNTKSDINKIYNPLKTKDVVLTDEGLISKLNSFNLKKYAMNSSATIISNYDEAIKGNFTDEFINANILYPDGFVTKINDDYYVIKDNADNLFFKEADITLISKEDSELYFKVKNINYASSCASGDATVPSIICTDAVTGDENDFRLAKVDGKWKIKEIKFE